MGLLPALFLSAWLCGLWQSTAPLGLLPYLQPEGAEPAHCQGPRLLLRTLPTPLGASWPQRQLVTFRIKKRRNRGGEKIQNRERRQVEEARKTHFALSSPRTAPAWEPAPLPRASGPGPREQPRLTDRRRRHTWGTEVPPEHSHAPAQQEAVQGRLPHRSGSPPCPGLPHLHEDSSSAGQSPLTSAPQPLRVQI